MPAVHGLRAVQRAYADDRDYYLIRELLIETYPLIPAGWNWDIRRWDGARWHHDDNAPPAFGDGLVRLWESEEGRLVGAVHPDGPGWACPELHPDWRHLEDEMLDWAESSLPAVSETGDSRYLRLFVWDYDAPRRRLLERRGYERTAEAGTIRRMRFGGRALPRPALAGGYRLRTTLPGDCDCERMAALHNAAFGRTFHSAAEYRLFSARSPSFRYDLDLIAEAGDGSFAAHVGLAYEERNRFAIIEPVCTHPDHLRRGLASTLILEGMHRVRALGATDAYVDTGERVPANELYDSLGFGEAYTGHTWRKTWPR